MAELYFFKLHPVIARINLYNAICRDPESIFPFLPKDQDTFLELLKIKAKENIENLSTEELSCIFAWAKKVAEVNKEDVQSRLFINGIDIFHEITNPDAADQFMRIFSEYQNISGEHFNIHMKPDRFSNFLIYGILFTGMFQDGDNEIFHYMKEEFGPLYEMAEKQYNLQSQNDSEKNVSVLYPDFIALYDSSRFSKDPITLLRYSVGSV